MELALWIFLIVLGLALLIKGADWFVDGAAGIAGKCGISPLVIGLTVVAFGTSAPELAVSVTSAIRGFTDLAVGNVVGSNIANILLILGLSALVRPLIVQKESLKLDLPVLLLASVLLVGLGIWGRAVEWWDGIILLAVLAVYVTVLIVKALRAQRKPAKHLEPPPQKEEKKEPKSAVGKWFFKMEQKTWFLIVLTIVGLGMVVGGGTLLVNYTQKLAQHFHVPERIIGLTVVAIGTSLPELVTSVVAARKGETDIAVGNIIGSNIFNILLVAGASSLFHPLVFSLEGNLIDSLVALAAALLLVFIALVGGKKLGRIGGAVMLACYIGYYVYLFLVPAV